MIRASMPEEEYHAHPSISKSGLWTIYKKTPKHYKFGDKKESNAMKFGKGAHCALLEPNEFEKRFVSGPKDRRGNTWKDAVEEAGILTLLTGGEYEDCLKLRDEVLKDSYVQRMVTGTTYIENSAFYTDERSKEECRIRPDLVNKGLRIGVDLKSTTDASPGAWKKRASDFGAHLQEAMYTYGWKQAGGCPIDAFVFLTVETEPPFVHAIYELEPNAAQEGWLIYEQAMEIYAKCKQENHWPGYGEGVIPLDIPPWEYKLLKKEERVK